MALPQMSAAADDREIIFNGLFYAAAPAALYGFDYENTTGLTFAYYGGQFNGNAIANDDIALTDNDDNYIVALRSTGVVSDSTSTTNFLDTANYLPLYVVTTLTGAITVIVDHRQAYGESGAGASFRIPVIQTVTSSATVTPTFDDDIVYITAQAAALALANPTGTSIDGLGIVIRIKDNGTARAISYDTEYRAIGVTLPTTTVISKTLYLAMIFNDTDTKWDVLAVGQEA